MSQDAYLGEANTPPSLHRYLYAYSNPTVWVDLTGYAGTAAQPGLRPDPIGYAITQHLQSDYDGNGQTVAEEILTPIVEGIKDRVNQIKIGVEVLGELQRSLFGLDKGDSSPKASESTESRIMVEGQGSTSTEGRPIEDPVPPPGGFQGNVNDEGWNSTAGNQIPEALPQTTETPIHQNGPTVLEYPQAEQLPPVMLSEGQGSEEEANSFPANSDDLLPELPRDAKGRIYPSDKIRIRPEQHPMESGETYAPRHHGQHYHVETRKDPAKSWNNKKNVTKIKPPNYKPGEGTGFLPGEKFPGAK